MFTGFAFVCCKVSDSEVQGLREGRLTSLRDTSKKFLDPVVLFLNCWEQTYRHGTACPFVFFFLFVLFQAITRYLYITFDSGKNVPVKIVHLAFVLEVCTLKYKVNLDLQLVCWLFFCIVLLMNVTNKMIWKWHRNYISVCPNATRFYLLMELHV